MSYNEYIDMFFSTQKKQCPFRAFTFDVLSCKTSEEYHKKFHEYRKCVLSVYDKLVEEERISNREILLKDDFNRAYNNDDDKHIDNNLYNPMIVGDMVTYFVHNDSITETKMLELFSKAMNNYNLNLSCHYATGVYETNEYKYGGQKLFKGYMPQILESLSKENGIIVTRETYLSSLNQVKLN